MTAAAFDRTSKVAAESSIALLDSESMEQYEQSLVLP